MNPFEKDEKKLKKVLFLVGPTAAGKTSWSIEIAKKFDGEILYADSRQIYKKMDIGTAKPEGEWKRDRLRRYYEVEGIPHYAVDFLDPGKRFSVAEFRERSIKAIRSIHARNHLPIIVGGTGLYVSSLVDNLQIPRVPANKKLRKSLEEKSIAELLHLLHTLDPDAKEYIDEHNKRRIIRALEVCIFTGEPFSAQRKRGTALFDSFQIGIEVDRETLYTRIDHRVDDMMKQGLLKELKDLLRQKYSWELPSMHGIGYFQFKPYLEGLCTLDEAIAHLKRDTRRYARRQLSWFRRDKRITWVKAYDEAETLVRSFLENKSSLV